MSAPESFRLPWSGRGVDYDEEDIAAVVEAMRMADPLTHGTYLHQFESDFSQYHGGVRSFAVSSCTAALELVATLTRIGPGDEVIIPAHTYCSTAIPFARRGARIVWADIHPEYRVSTAQTIEPLITKKTKVIVAVHLYGLAVPMQEICDIARDRGVLVVEDCAQAIGASCNGLKVGTWGDFGCFSFHAQKNLTTLGEGGMLTVRDESTAALVPGLRQNGHRPYPADRDCYWLPAMVNTDFDIDGVWPYKLSLGEVQCALGSQLIGKLDEITEKRNRDAKRVIATVENYPELSFQRIPIGSTHSYHLLSVRYDGEDGKNRDDLIRLLAFKHHIQAIIQYYPLYRYPLFVRSGYGDATCPNTDDFYDSMLSLPFYPWFSNDDFDYLSECLIEALQALRNT